MRTCFYIVEYCKIYYEVKSFEFTIGYLLLQNTEMEKEESPLL